MRAVVLTGLLGTLISCGGGSGDGGGLAIFPVVPPTATTPTTPTTPASPSEPTTPTPPAATYTIGGNVSGLLGSGLVLQNNAGDDLPQAADGGVRFVAPLADGAAYAVTVKTQPSNPTQTCTVNNASGTVAAADVNDVKVICATESFSVGGKVTGLAGAGLVLQNNGAGDLSVAADGTFSFAQKVASGAAYVVTVKAQPTAPSQTCTVSRASGTVSASAVSDLAVVCSTRSFTVSGTLSGLAGTGLVLQNNAGDDLVVTANSGFSFAVPVASGASYVVSVKTQPSGPAQTCTVTNASGSVSDNNVGNVSVLCAIDTHAVSGTVSGLQAGSSLVLQNNGADNLRITADGSFSFATPVADSSTYLVTVYTQPSTWLTCSVVNGAGTALANVANVAVACSAPQAQASTLAGSGAQGSTDGTGAAASFNVPHGVAVDASGNLYVSDTSNNLIRKITPAGVVSTFAGSGASGSANGTAAAASFSLPYAVATDAGGNLYVGDTNNNLIRKITPAGVVTTLAGSGGQGSSNGTGAAASFFVPTGVAVDASGNVYVADLGNNLIRKITSAGVVTTLAGSGAAGSTNGTGTAASFDSPYGVAVDASGNVYVSDQLNKSIRKITAGGVVTTWADLGTGGAPIVPYGVAVDASGNVFVTETARHVIHRITAAGVVTRLAGSTGVSGSTNGTAALFNNPFGVAVDAIGNVYVADGSNNLIRKITAVPVP